MEHAYLSDNSNVLNLPPKHITGNKRNVAWSIIFNKKDRKWQWKVTVKLEPQVFYGTTDDQASAQAEVNAYVERFA